jgi:DNA polymerase-4
MDIFLEYTPLVEPLSLDEAFLDVTTNNKNNPSATLIAKEIKQRIKKKTKLVASAGVSINKFLAKTASDVDKPDGLYVITPEKAEDFIEKLPIEKFFGVGKKTAEKMRNMGILFGRDLKNQSLAFLVQHFGKVGGYFYGIARGIDNRPVNPNRIRKSFGREITFDKDIKDKDEIILKLNDIAKELFSKIKQRIIRGRTLTLKIKYHDFEQITRSKTEIHPIIDKNDFFAIAHELINHEDILVKPIRLLGLSVSNFIDNEHKEYIQLKIEFQNFQLQ